MAIEGSDVIAGVEDRELAEVARGVPALPNHGVEAADRFAQAVRVLAEKRAQVGWPEEDDSDLAVFVLVDHPRKVGGLHGGTSFADPIAQGTALLGYMFFSNGDANRGQVIPISVGENEYLDWLEEKGLGGFPIAAVYREAKEMVVRCLGVNDTARRVPIRDKEPSATLEELEQGLRHFHRSRVMTPTGGVKGLWKPGCAGKYIPGAKPEKSIQLELIAALGSWFGDVVWVRGEDVTRVGRIDVCLLTSEMDGRQSYWIILELKVIKSFTYRSRKVSDETNVKVIVKGVKQAGAYRANVGAVEGILEIYDLRKEKSPDLTSRKQVVDALGMYSPQPKVNVWPVYGSAEHARDAGETGV